MLWMLGAMLTLVGSMGVGFCILGRMGAQTAELKLFSMAFRILASEVAYSHAPLPEALKSCGCKTGGKLGTCFKQMADEIGGPGGKTLEYCWYARMSCYLEQSVLSRKEKEQILTFPSRTGFLDRGLQEQTILLFAEEIEEQAGRAQEAERENRRMVIGLSTAGGLLAAILLC